MKALFFEFSVFFGDFLLFFVVADGELGLRMPGQVQGGRGRGAVSIDRAAALRFRVSLTHGLRFCHSVTQLWHGANSCDGFMSCRQILFKLLNFRARKYT